MGKRARVSSAALAAALLLAPALARLALSPRAGVPDAEGGCLVLVLGFPGRADGSPGWIQRYRVAAGLSAAARHGCRQVLLSGGHPHSRAAEADEMERAALEQGAEPSRLALDRTARTTRENVAGALARLRPGERLFIASDWFHAERARRYACRQRPDVCARVRTAAAPVPLELMPYAWASAYYNGAALVRDALFGSN